MKKYNYIQNKTIQKLPIRLTDKELDEKLDEVIKRHNFLVTNSNFHINGFDVHTVQTLITATLLEFGLLEIIQE